LFEVISAHRSLVCAVCSCVTLFKDANGTFKSMWSAHTSIRLCGIYLTHSISY